MPPILDPQTEAAIARAVAAARSGQLQDGYAIVRAALDKGNDAAALNALCGLLAHRLGNLDSAIAHLETAHRTAPADVTVAGNLIDALIAADRLDRALDLATPALATHDSTLRVLRLRAYLLQVAGRHGEAAAAYRVIVAARPDDFESWNNLGNAAIGAGDTDLSIVALERAVALQPGAAPTRINLAASLLTAGRSDDACEVLRRAMEDFPADAKPAMELASILKVTGHVEQALALLNEACRREPSNPEPWVSLGSESFLAFDSDRAEAALARALELAPGNTDASVVMAMLLEHTGRAEELDAFLRNRAAASVSDGVLDLIRALICSRDGRFADGLAVLARVPDDLEPVRCAQLRGQFHDRLGETSEAFTAFTRMNRELASDPSDPVSRAAYLRASLKANCDLTTKSWYRRWHQVAAPERASPCFLVGFPRSGTTLLDTMLMGHPVVRVLEEKPVIEAVEQASGGFDRLPNLDEGAVAELRSLYWQQAERWQAIDVGTLLIDKFPTHLNQVPLIHRLFPDAKFVLALRHPCDVVLSCFITNFTPNDAMANFLELETAARFYDQTFAFWERAREIMPVKVHTIVYEEMIVDPERHMRGVFDYLGLDWHAGVLDHQRTAAGRGIISTASYAQVTQPLYQRAAGRWIRYRKYLEPVLPILAPWVERFGYSLEG